MIQHRKRGDVDCVLDTKYKVAGSASTADISQVQMYADLMNCCSAFLVYPEELKQPLRIQAGGVEVRSLVFDLSEDLEVAGRRFLNDLLSREGVSA